MKKHLLLLLFGIILLSFTQHHKKVNIFSIGDSTMCNFSEKYLSQFGGPNYPIRGWMQMAPQFFTGDVVIHNAAQSGRSSKSFRDEGWWKKVIDSVQAGDYVFIMFGANDQKPDPARHTDPATTYRQNLMNYINETRAKGAHPVLFTSIVRRIFDNDGKLKDTFGDYIDTARAVAKEMNVPLVDLNKKTGDMVQSYGPEESKKLFLFIQPGLFTKLPDGKKDNTHLSIEGATKVAELAVQGIKELHLPLASYIK
jgi:lysophospholipase L1-like esterase